MSLYLEVEGAPRGGRAGEWHGLARLQEDFTGAVVTKFYMNLDRKNFILPLSGSSR